MIAGMTAARLGDADPRKLGPYRLLGVLGTGGVGTVYLGRGSPRRGTPKKLAAVRAVRPELLRDRQLRARLRHEARVAATVSSRYVAATLGCELDSEQPWLAAALVPGPSLAALVSRYGPLPEPGVRALGAALARGLAALHAAGVAHRDLRPRNVLLSAAAPHLVDHGLGLGRTDVRHPGHAGPAGEDTADPAGDVFELGALLVLAAGGHQPFAGSLLPAAREDPDLSCVPEALCPALLACLHKTPESRPRPEPLARALDLEDTAERPAAEWLPEAYLHEIGAHEDAVQKLTGRRLFGR